VTVASLEVQRVHGIGRDDSLREALHFVAVCPGCTRRQTQHGFSRAALLRALDDDLDIHAYCVQCRNFWPISDEERLLLIAAIAG
jgi:hypothetical protein